MDERVYFLELVIPYRTGLDYGDEDVNEGADYVVLEYHEFKKLVKPALTLPDLCSGVSGYLRALGVPKENAEAAGAAVTKITKTVVGITPSIYAASWDVNGLIDIMLVSKNHSEVVHLELRLATKETVS